MKLGITGSTGQLGALVIERLLNDGVEPSGIVALARDTKKAETLKSKGADVRIGDYNQPDSLEKAFEGIDRLLMISASDIGRRQGQHKNVVEAAKKAGVKHLVYTSLFHADTSVSPLAEEHRQTEELIRESGIPYTFLRNNWYTENHTDDLVRAKKWGFIESAAEDGKVASAARKDYAEAAAKVLTGEGHEGKTYELAGREWSFYDLAETATEVLGRKVKYKPVNEKKRKRHLKLAKLPPHIIDFVTGLDISIKEGALEGSSPDLENLLGHKPEDIKETFTEALS